MSKTVVWAHRGASAYAPENTLIAFQKAIEMKADGIELDVQMTKDGRLVVIHDETVDRVSLASGWVKDFTFEEIQKLNVNQNFPELGPAKIPTLEEVYDLCKNTSLSINVELKTGVVFYKDIERRVVELTKEMGMWDHTIFSSFNHASVLQVKKLDKSAQTGFLYADGHLDMPQYAKKHGVNALHPALYNIQYPDFIKTCKEMGIKLHVWTVNEQKYMELLCENGIEAIITNYPDVARKVVDAYER